MLAALERGALSALGMKEMKNVISSSMGKNWKTRRVQAQKKCMKDRRLGLCVQEYHGLACFKDVQT